MGVEQRPCRAAGQGRGPQVRHRLLHLAAGGRGRVGQQLRRGTAGGDLREASWGRERTFCGWIQGEPESAKSFCINRKKNQEKNSSTGRDCIMDRTFDHVYFFVFCLFFGFVVFFFPNRMSFLKQMQD